MHALVIFQTILSRCALLLLLTLFVLALWRGLYRRLPVFSIYLAVELAIVIYMLLLYHMVGPASDWYFYFYFLDNFVVHTAEAACIFELISVVCGPYLGVRRLVLKALCSLAVLSLVLAAADVLLHRHDFITVVFTLKRDLALAGGMTTVALCLLTAHFYIYPHALERNVIVGLALNFLIQGINDSLAFWPKYPYEVWGTVQTVIAISVFLIWLAALLKPLPPPLRPLSWEALRDFLRQRKKPKRGDAPIWPAEELPVFPYGDSGALVKNH